MTSYTVHQSRILGLHTWLQLNILHVLDVSVVFLDILDLDMVVQLVMVSLYILDLNMVVQLEVVFQDILDLDIVVQFEMVFLDILESDMYFCSCSEEERRIHVCRVENQNSSWGTLKVQDTCSCSGEERNIHDSSKGNN